MKKNITKSLSSKIVFFIVLISSLMIVTIYTVSEKFNKEAFYSIELDKANIILKTIEPLIALDLYLGTNGNINSIGKDLIINPNILSFKILKNNKPIYEIKSNQYSDRLENSFTIKKEIHQPNSDKTIGHVILKYSSENYKQLINKYREFTIGLSVLLIFLLISLSLYIKKLLTPLRKISKSLKNYAPDKDIDIPYVNEDNEIGLISNALHEMQNKILQYSKKQKDINKNLEEMVNKKTLELQTQLYTNSLTKLPNRLSLVKDIKFLENGALIIINIDDFKEINDFFGHVVGDKVLIQLSNKLKVLINSCKNVELLHFHSDEFALLIKEKISDDDFLDMIKKFIYEIENMIFNYENNKMGIRVTIGGVQGIKDVLEKADIALKLAKKRRIPYLIYDENLNVEKQYEENMKWIKNLKQAIQKDKIVPFFQPLYDNNSNKIISCECLIRLIDEDDNVISPYKFLTIAKKSRLYNKLTMIMIEKSCKYFEDLDCDFSINLSIYDMLDPEIVAYLKEKIETYNVSNKIILEILETEDIEDYDDIATFINDMKALGCKIAIDDFGSGYSSFEYLLKLNIDYIKIDGTLIKNLDTDKNSKIVVETVVEFAKKLNVRTVAEFVHNEAVLKKVKELNVDRSQGFYLCEPQRDVRGLIQNLSSQKKAVKTPCQVTNSGTF